VRHATQLTRSLWLAAIFAIGAGAALGADRRLEVDPSRSTLTFKAYKDGWFSSLGHDHTIAARGFAGAVLLGGTLEASSVTLTVDTRTLDVLDPAADA